MLDHQSNTKNVVILEAETNKDYEYVYFFGIFLYFSELFATNELPQ